MQDKSKMYNINNHTEKRVELGPTTCDLCGFWPARRTERGNRCHLCEAREWCAEHPVPLPKNRETPILGACTPKKLFQRLAQLGHEPSIHALLKLKKKDE